MKSTLNWLAPRAARAIAATTALLACCVTTQAENLATIQPQQPFMPDYLYPDTGLFQSHVQGQGEQRHFSTFGMDNDDLAYAADNFADHSLNTTQRLLNHQWLYYGHHNIEGEKGSGALRELLQSSVKNYWRSLRATRFKDSQVLPDGDGAGKLNEFDYHMRLKSDALKLSVSYAF